MDSEFVKMIVSGVSLGVLFFILRHVVLGVPVMSEEQREKYEREMEKSRAQRARLREQRERTRIAHRRKKELRAMGKRR